VGSTAQPLLKHAQDFEAPQRSAAWRCGEVLICAAGLLALSPLLVVLAAAIWFTDGSPILFRQKRVGRNGRHFQLLKLRSMRTGKQGMQVTSAGDPRVTRIGRTLRHYKLDEIPQLWNVVRGDMSLVGPRPEVPRYVDYGQPVWRAILSRRPGITDLPTLVYRNEEEILAQSPNPEKSYREVILPDKLAMNLAYARRSSAWQDLRLVFLSVRYSLQPARFDANAIRSAFLKS
jgi:lipopolysaccharide/colanic/teichoic acid biosynthesis glycosyltransferase